MSPRPAPTRGAATESAWERRALDQVLRSTQHRFLSRSRQFVAAARGLVAEKGIDGLTLRVLLERTGLSRRAFYERFETKDDLLLAVFEETIRSASARYREGADAFEDPLDRLRFIVQGMIEGAWSRPTIPHSIAMSREHLRLAGSRPGDLRCALQPLTELIAGALALGIASGRFRQADPHETAVLIHNLVSSTLHAALLAAPGEEGRAHEKRVKNMANAVWEFCRRAVVAPDPGNQRNP